MERLVMYILCTLLKNLSSKTIELSSVFIDKQGICLWIFFNIYSISEYIIKGCLIIYFIFYPKGIEHIIFLLHT